MYHPHPPNSPCWVPSSTPVAGQLVLLLDENPANVEGKKGQNLANVEGKKGLVCVPPSLPVAGQLVLPLDDDHHVQLYAALNVEVLVVMSSQGLGAELPVAHARAAARRVCWGRQRHTNQKASMVATGLWSWTAGCPWSSTQVEKLAWAHPNLVCKSEHGMDKALFAKGARFRGTGNNQISGLEPKSDSCQASVLHHAIAWELFRKGNARYEFLYFTTTTKENCGFKQQGKGVLQVRYSAVRMASKEKNILSLDDDHKNQGRSRNMHRPLSAVDSPPPDTPHPMELVLDL
eukprot:1159202-Pelagomonas_calceolata.AAC.4